MPSSRKPTELLGPVTRKRKKRSVYTQEPLKASMDVEKKGRSHPCCFKKDHCLWTLIFFCLTFDVSSCQASDKFNSLCALMFLSALEDYIYSLIEIILEIMYDHSESEMTKCCITQKPKKRQKNYILETCKKNHSQVTLIFLSKNLK